MPLQTVSTPDLEILARELDSLLDGMPGVGQPGFDEKMVLAVVEEQLTVDAELKRRNLTAGEPFDPYCEF
jgi:hypothetical protein